MKKTLIIYASKGGSTKQYAQWIAQELGNVTCISLDQYVPTVLDDIDVLIFGSYVKMGVVQMKKFLIDHYSDFSHKELYMFTVGLIPIETPEGQKSWNAIPAHIRESIIYHEKFGGKINKKKVNMIENIFVKMINNKYRKIFDKSEIRHFVEEVKRRGDVDVAEIL